MLALLVPGTGMGGGQAATAPDAPTVGGHAFGRRVTNVQPYLTVLLSLLMLGVGGG